MLPFLGVKGAKEAFNFIPGLIIPRQFGPIMEMSDNFAIFLIFCSKIFPCFPSSANPEEIIIMPFTFFWEHSSIIFGTIFAGTAITAKSTGSLICFIDGTVLTPKTSF